MAVAFDAVSSGGGTSQSGNGTITLSHTCTGSNLLLIVGVANDAGGSAGVSGITYNGTSMTALASINNSDSFANILINTYYLIAPSTGANNIVVTRSGSPVTNSSVCGISFTGVDQTTPLGTAATNTQNNGSTPSVTVAGATNDIIVDFQAILNSPTTATAGSGQTGRVSLLVAGGSLIASTEAGAASVLMDWTLGANKWSSAVGVAVKPAPTGPTINTQPQSTTVYETQTANFTVTATTSGGTLHYQWKKNGSNVGTDSNSYTTPATDVAGYNGASYTVDVTDDNGTTTSNAAILTVLYRPLTAWITA